MGHKKEITRSEGRENGFRTQRTDEALMEGLVVLLREECQRQWGQPDGDRHIAETHRNPCSCPILIGNYLQDLETARLLFK